MCFFLSFHFILCFCTAMLLLHSFRRSRRLIPSPGTTACVVATSSKSSAFRRLPVSMWSIVMLSNPYYHSLHCALMHTMSTSILLSGHTQACCIRVPECAPFWLNTFFGIQKICVFWVIDWLIFCCLFTSFFVWLWCWRCVSCDQPSCRTKKKSTRISCNHKVIE